MTTGPQTPNGLNHLVLKVRDLDESHWFWTACLGFRHVGTGRRPDNGTAEPRMRFYNGVRDSKLHHHDIALIEQPMSLGDHSPGLHHVAIGYPTEEAWEAQIRHLTDLGVPLHRRVHRGATRSIHVIDPNGYQIELVCDLPREVWENDIDAALNRVELPVTA